MCRLCCQSYNMAHMVPTPPAFFFTRMEGARTRLIDTAFVLQALHYIHSRLKHAQAPCPLAMSQQLQQYKRLSPNMPPLLQCKHCSQFAAPSNTVGDSLHCFSSVLVVVKTPMVIEDRGRGSKPDGERPCEWDMGEGKEPKTNKGR